MIFIPSGESPYESLRDARYVSILYSNENSAGIHLAQGQFKDFFMAATPLPTITIFRCCILLPYNLCMLGSFAPV